MTDNATDKKDYLLRIIGILILFLVVANVGTFWLLSDKNSEAVAVAVVEQASQTLKVTPNNIEQVAAVPAVATDPLLQPVVVTTPKKDELQLYVQVTDGCGPHFEGECLRARSGPGTEYATVAALRSGMVLKVGEVVETPERIWYEIVFDEWLRYPERVSGRWYVAGEFVEEVYDVGPMELTASSTPTDKVITVDRSDQMLYAYDGEDLFMKESISTGLILTPTPRGTFTIFRKTPSRYMQGPLEYLAVSKYYDLPGVPWNMYFTEQGAVVHGAYWHDSFGSQYSSGCVNIDPDLAKQLYDWSDIGTTIIVRD